MNGQTFCQNSRRGGKSHHHRLVFWNSTSTHHKLSGAELVAAEYILQWIKTLFCASKQESFCVFLEMLILD